jgi:hypothetical protein
VLALIRVHHLPHPPRRRRRAQLEALLLKHTLPPWKNGPHSRA